MRIHVYKHFKGVTYLASNEILVVSSKVRKLKSGDTCELWYDTVKKAYVVLTEGSRNESDEFIQSLTCATDEWSDCGMVIIYARAGKPDKLFCRDVMEFASKVDKDKYPDTKAKFRFEYIRTDRVTEGTKGIKVIKHVNPEDDDLIPTIVPEKSSKVSIMSNVDLFKSYVRRSKNERL